MHCAGLLLCPRAHVTLLTNTRNPGANNWLLHETPHEYKMSSRAEQDCPDPWQSDFYDITYTYASTPPFKVQENGKISILCNGFEGHYEVVEQLACLLPTLRKRCSVQGNVALAPEKAMNGVQHIRDGHTRAYINSMLQSGKYVSYQTYADVPTALGYSIYLTG